MKWTPLETKILINKWKEFSRDEIEKELPGRTWKAIESKAEDLGLKRIRPKPKKLLTSDSSFQKSAKEVSDIEKQNAKLLEVKDFNNLLLGAVKNQPSKVSIPNRWKIGKGRLIESAVLMLSDVHCGRINEFLNFDSGKLEITYNVEKCEEEFNQLAKNLYEINSLLSTSFQIDDLYIFGLGDLVEGDLIFKGQKWFVDYGVGKQIVLLTKIITDFIVEMLKMHKTVTFIDVVGNHGRMTERREAAPIENSFDYLLGKILEIVFKNEPRVKIVVPDAKVYLQKIYSWRYLLQHGENVYSWMGIPYYGIVRQGKSRRMEISYDLECIGHHHQRMEIPVSSATSSLVNGSFIEKDQSVWEKFGRITKAEQWYFGVSPKRPRTWAFNVDLVKRSERIKMGRGKIVSPDSSF
jgi:hypothetical protein